MKILKGSPFALSAILAVTWIMGVSLAAPQNTATATITLTSTTRYQTLTGWEATGVGDVSDPLYPSYRDALFNTAINELGITRIRLETCRTPCAGGTPGTGFDLTNLDENLDNGIVPYRQKLQAAGGRLLINLCIVGNGYANDPQGYAQAALGLMQHMQSKYGFVPDYWEIALEPDNFGWGNPSNVANALVATATLLKAHGFTPKFIVPSNTNMTSAVSWFDTIYQTPGAAQWINEISYHRYNGVSDASLQALASRSVQHGIPIAMLEHIGADYNELYQDLTLGRNSTWQQYTLSYDDNTDDGTKYLLIDRAHPSAVTLSRTAKFLRQYFKYIQPGAVRIGASTLNPAFAPVGFINKNGSYVVVVKASAGGSFSVAGLPAGTYGINFTTNQQYNVNLADVPLMAGQLLATKISAAGVLTIYGKSKAASSPTPTRSTTPSRTLTKSPTAATRTKTPTATLSRTPSKTAITSATLTPTRTPTRSLTPTRTKTLTPSPSRTLTPLRTPTPTYTPDGAWIFCARENYLCAFTGTHQVRFGANGKYSIKTFTNGVKCSTKYFGDPIAGTSKFCHYQ